MKYRLNKYFADELTPDEKFEFLLEVNKEGGLREEFIENHHLVVLFDWLFPKDDRAFAQQKLSEFMSRIEDVNNK